MEASEYEVRTDGYGRNIEVIVDGLVFPFGNMRRDEIYGLDKMSREEFKEYYDHY